MAQDNLPNLALFDVLKGTLFTPEDTGVFPLAAASDGQTLGGDFAPPIYYGRRVTIKRVLITNIQSNLDSQVVQNVTVKLVSVPVAPPLTKVEIVAPKVVSLDVGESLVLDTFDDLPIEGDQFFFFEYEFDSAPIANTTLNMVVDVALGAETR